MIKAEPVLEIETPNIQLDFLILTGNLKLSRRPVLEVLNNYDPPPKKRENFFVFWNVENQRIIEGK